MRWLLLSIFIFKPMGAMVDNCSTNVMKRLYKKGFSFQATRFEINATNGFSDQGSINTRINASVMGEAIHFDLRNTIPQNIVPVFVFWFESLEDNLLADRIQYQNHMMVTPAPFACNIFFGMDGTVNRVRFATKGQYSIKVFEFYGNEIR